MNTNIRDIVLLILAAVCIFVLPAVIRYSFAEKKTDTFFKRVDEDYEDCLKNANEDTRELRLCREIKRASELAFTSSTRVSDSYSNISIIQTVLFVLAAIIFDLKRRIEVLEKKPDA